MSKGARAKQALSYGAFPLVVLALINGAQTAEPTGISFATQGIEHHFHVGDGIVGFMPLAASIVGIPAVLLVGPLADRVHRVRLIAILLGLWSAALGIAALAPFFALLFISRSFVGALESNQPAGLSLMADYYAVNRRGKVMSQFQLGGAIGGGFGALLGPLTDLFGFRVVFWFWVPVGIVLALMTLRLPETVRGQQDALVYADALPLVGAVGVEDPLALSSPVQQNLRDHLPQPLRTGTCDYGNLTKRELMGQLWSIRSMWFGVLSITTSQILLNALAFWSPAYFERFHHLSGSGAAGVQGILGLGSILGILLGGIISDRMMARGNLNGRISVIVVGSIGATAALFPAFVMHDLLLATPLFFLGGFFITLPIGPAEAMLQDVVVAELRGRANSVRSVVRAASAIGPTMVGLMSDVVGLAAALSLLTPIYAIGGLIVLKARQSYATDLAFVFAEASRTGGGTLAR